MFKLLIVDRVLYNALFIATQIPSAIVVHIGHNVDEASPDTSSLLLPYNWKIFLNGEPPWVC
nr:unnamed protein product [Callosobruchus analis]